MSPRRLLLPALALALPLAPLADARDALAAGHASPTTLCAERADRGDVTACRRAVERHPDDLSIRHNLATAYMAVGDYDAAVDAYGELAARKPEDARVQYAYASVLGFVRRYVDAVAPLETLLRLEPDNVDAWRLASLVYQQTKQDRQSFEATRRAAELGDAPSMFDMMWHYETGNGVDADPAEALAWVTRAAEAGHIGAMDLLVETYLEGNRFAAAPDDAKAEAWALRARQAREAD